MPTTMLEHALAYAKAGFRVFPCVPGEKRPLTKRGFHDASSDEATVSRLWRQQPNANIGGATGVDYFVLDVDVKNGAPGFESFDVLRGIVGCDLATAQSTTPTTGGHFHFSKPSSWTVRSRAGILPGLDVRGEGGYVVLPPSEVGGRHYEWVLDDWVTEDQMWFAQASQALLDFLSSKQTATALSEPSALGSETPEQLARLTLLLDSLADSRADDRDSWIHAGMAIHSECPGPSGLKAWEAFSRRSSKFKAGECAKLWRGFGASANRANRLTIGSLVHWAREDSGDPNLGRSPSTSEPTGTGTERWTNPLPLTDFTAPQFPTAALPPTTRKMAEAASGSVGIQLEMAAMAILAVLGAALAKKAGVQVKVGYVESLNLYVLLIAEPGSGKSPLFKIVLMPLHRYEREVVGTTVAAFEPTEEQPSPKLPTLICSDGTPEALKSLLAENDGRLFLADTEEIAISTALGRYSGAPKIEVFLQAHDGDTIRVDRKGRPSEFIEEPLLSMLGCMQEGSLKDLGRAATVAARGLFARCLPVAPPSLIGQRPTNRPAIDAAVTVAYEGLVDKLCRVPIPASPAIISLSKEAATAYQQFLEWLEPQCRSTAPLGERVKGWGAKLGSHIMRIAGILHVAWCEENGVPWSTPLSLETFNHARAIVEFLVPHVQRMFAIACDDSEDADGQFILDYLVDHDSRETTEADLRRDTKHRFRGRFKRERFTAALDLLIEHGWLRRAPSERTGKPGRPSSSVIEVNPEAFPA